ncbi:MAG: leucyl/phenylalanyl-tRNA--protein transferase [Sphingobium sp.]
MMIDPLLLLRAYSIGIFPMSDDRDATDVYWVEPRERAILPLDGFRLSRSLAKTIRRDRFTVTANRAFGRIVALCAEAAPDRPSTWINGPIERAYRGLHERGFAHSVEVWDGEELVGGLYGVSLGRAFFGESMVSRRTDASKVALAWLVARLRFADFRLLDCQFMTSHLQSLGAVEIDQRAYLQLLGDALGGVSLDDALPSGAGAGAGGEGAAGVASAPAVRAFAPLAAVASPGPPSVTVSGPLSGHSIAQLLIQTS